MCTPQSGLLRDVHRVIQRREKREEEDRGGQEDKGENQKRETEEEVCWVLKLEYLGSGVAAGFRFALIQGFLNLCRQHSGTG